MPGFTLRKASALFGVCLLIFVMLQTDCFARVGRGGSFGSRGSRTYTSPSRSYNPGTYQQPRSNYNQNQPYGQRYNQPAPGSSGGFLRGLAGGLAGGFLGSLLFRSLGFGGQGSWGGGGIGLFEILLVAVLIFGVIWFIRKRRQQASGAAYYQGTGAMGQDYAPPYQEPRYTGGMIDAPPPEGPIPQGPGSVMASDPHFDERAFKDMAMDVFFRIQGAWAERNPQLVRSLLTGEMYSILEKDAEELRREKKLNKLDNIAVRSVDITEDWQEQGADYITVKFYANLLDYVVDETTGQVVDGSKTEPVKFEEYWTFVRPSGRGEWLLSAINQAE